MNSERSRRTARVTVTLDNDVAMAVDVTGSEDDVGLSEAVNRLVWAGMTSRQQRAPCVHISYDLGTQVDVTNIGEILELLDQDTTSPPLA